MDDKNPDDWSVADLAARLTGATSSDLSIVIRIISARLAAVATATTDPGSVLGDIRCTLESLRSATRIILYEFELLDDNGMDALDDIDAVIGLITQVAENI